MKTPPLVLYLLCACLIAPSVMASGREALPVNGIAAIVNDEVITKAQVNGAITTQIRVWLLENRTATQGQMEAKLKELQAAALDDLIDRKLIISEFKEGQGVVVEGRLKGTGEIQSRTLMVKHSEEYKKPDSKHSMDKQLLEESIFKNTK